MAEDITQKKTEVEIVTVNLGDNSYPILIGEDILANLGEQLRKLALGSKVLLVTNPVVKGLYGKKATESLKAAGFEVVEGLIPDGEKYKTLESAQALYNIAFDARLDRKSAVVALGGGVIGDLAGFVAATYMRGVPFIQVPTTLLAQVDSSVGGKVAVNHPKGKNIIGSFYQPKLVLADVGVLRTLDDRQFRAGMAEVLKYGVIWDDDFFAYLEENLHRIKNMEVKALIHVVKTSCEIKAHVVAQDEKETGVRAILNYGHTFGHALEALTDYKYYVHGEAIAVGMVQANRMAVGLNMLDADTATRINNLISKVGLPTEAEQLSKEQIIKKMYYDKKVQEGKIHFILPEDIGRVRIRNDINEKNILAAL